jgi:type VI secretion system secreted protein Hcp
MPIYMNYDNPKIEGNVTTQGFEKWIECHSLSWGAGRSIGTAARGATTREHSEPHVAEVMITKPSDGASGKLLKESLLGKLDSKVKLSLTTTSADAPQVFLKIELEGVAVSGYSMSSGGDNPTESISLNFTKILYAFTPMGEDVTGGTDIHHFDLKTMTGD